MKPVEEIRRANLLSLIEEAGSAAKLAALTGVKAPYISQVSRAVQNSKGKGPRVMGPDVARRIETRMKKPQGWMDTDHSALSITSDLNGREGQLVGLFRLLSEAEQAVLVNSLTQQLRRDGPPDSAGAGPELRH